MSKYTQKQMLVAALTARGERLVDTGKLDKWTRSYQIGRDLEGNLRPIARDYVYPFYFLGDNGALRVGAKRTYTIPLSDAAKGVLLLEGREALNASKKPNRKVATPVQ